MVFEKFFLRCTRLWRAHPFRVTRECHGVFGAGIFPRRVLKCAHIAVQGILERLRRWSPRMLRVLLQPAKVLLIDRGVEDENATARHRADLTEFAIPLRAE